jgi:hypothetical protein
VELKVVGRVISEGSRAFDGSGEIILPDGEIAVSAEGKYMKMKINKIAGDQLPDDDWFFSKDNDDPSEIEIP